MRNFFALIIIILLPYNIFAGNTTYKGVVRGKEIFLGQVLVVEDQWYQYMQQNPTDWEQLTGTADPYSPYSPNKRFTNGVTNALLSLRWEGSDGRVYNGTKPWVYELIFELKGWSANGTLLGIETRKLRIDYNMGVQQNGHQSEFKDWDMLRMPDIHRMEAKITGISYSEDGGQNFNGVTSIMSQYGDIFLEGAIDVERYFSLEQGANYDLHRVELNSTNRTITHAWAYVEGAEEYDFEWLYLSTNLESGVSPVKDWSKASRVTVRDPHYSLELPYEEGIVYFRVRAVGYGNKAGQRIYGSWQENTNALEIAYTGGELQPFEADMTGQKDKNWTYSATYAEEGKRAEAISFFDGTGRGRQSLTKDNSTGKVLIGESFFDHEGRQALSIAPSPHSGGDGRMKFYENYNLNASGQPFSKSDFDLDVHYGYPNGTPQAVTLSTSSGSAAYYSSNNNGGQLNEKNSYIPSADARPYTRTSFDDQGRPMLMSGAGTILGHGGGHEQRYFYGDVLQEELDRWFGGEIGYAGHYRKKILVDPNGQVSVSFETLSGQVVLTALEGTTPQNLQTLDQQYAYSTSQTVVSDLSVFNQYQSGRSSWMVDKQFTPTHAGNYVFDYDFDPQQLDDCLDGACKYELSFKLYDSEGRTVLLNTGQSYFQLNSYTNNGQSTTSLNTPMLVEHPHTVNLRFTLIVGGVNGLSIGRYTLVKELRLLNTEERLAAWRTQLETELNNFLATDIDNSACLNFAGATSLGDGDCDDVTAVLDANAYCDALLASLIIDMSPGGQYFDNLPDPNNRNQWLETHVAQNPSTLGTVFSDLGFQSWDEVRDNWEDSFGELLALYHPEFCHYSYRCVTLVDVYTPWYSGAKGFDYSLSDPTLNYAAAVSNEYIRFNSGTGEYEYPESGTSNSLACTLSASSFVAGYALLQDDASLPTALKEALKVKLCNFASGLTMLEVAAMGATSHDEVWSKFVSLYISTKGMLMDDYMEVANSSCPFLEDDIDTDYQAITAAGFSIRVPQQHEMADAFVNQPDMSDPIAYIANQANENLLSMSLCGYEEATVMYDCSLSPSSALFLQLSLKSGVVNLTEEINGSLSSCSNCELGIACIKSDIEAHLVTAGLTNAEVYVDMVGGLLSDSVRIKIRVPSTTYSSVNNVLTQTALTTYDNGMLYLYAAGDVVVSSSGFTEVSCTQNYPVCNCAAMTNLIDDPELNVDDNAQSVANYYNDALYKYTGEAYTNFSAAITNVYNACEGLEGGFSSFEAYQAFAASLNTMLANYPELQCNPFEGDIPSCEEELADLQNFYDQAAFLAELETTLERLRAAFISTCQSTGTEHGTENFTLTYNDEKSHVMLYYYDLVGNLVRTVSPTGVRELNISTQGAAVKAARDNRSDNPLRPAHRMFTDYRYNTVGALITSESPDRGRVFAYYDELVRSRASQDAQQVADNEASYIIYDALGRTMESGVLKPQAGCTISSLRNYLSDPQNVATINNASFPNMLIGATLFRKEEVRKVYYNENTDGLSNLFAEGQQNLRNRVSLQTYAPDGVFADYKIAYSYDIAGNAKEIWQYNSYLEGNTLKHLEYKYDLISGSVHEVHYQKGMRDQLSHRYAYDALNRIVRAESSLNGYIWNTESKYEYYEHGPLRRQEIGDEKVQGLDYAYTLNGWIKSVNSTSLTSQRDPGRDGSSTSSIHAHADLHKRVANDIYGYAVYYFTGDYTAVNGALSSTANSQVSAIPGTASLYNGNISYVLQAQTKPQIGTNQQQPMSVAYKRYQYDQLHRIKSSAESLGGLTSLQSTNDFGAIIQSNAYETSYSYDPNGNILSLNRHNELNTQIDQLTYWYNSVGGTTNNNAQTPLSNNQLRQVTDNPSLQGLASYDLDGQSNAANYVYNADGSIISDASEHISNIKWSAENKVLEVIRTGTNADLAYVYDFKGNRTTKIVKHKGSGATWSYTHYVRDVQGNVMGVYEYQKAQNSPAPHSPVYDPMSYPHITLKEHHLYGSSRLGIIKRDVLVSGPTTIYADGNGNTLGANAALTASIAINSALNDMESKKLSTFGKYKQGDSLDHVLDMTELQEAVSYELKPGGGVYLGTGLMVAQRLERLRGNHRYEIGNFRGDVHQVISDVKVRIGTIGLIATSYEADVYQVADQYPFGWEMPERHFGEEHRFGFNGQEKSPEISNGHTTALFWEYDSRIAKRWNVDPRPVVSISPYAVMQGNPIMFSDPLGDTTRMYSTNGNLEYTFNDNYPNEEHFFDKIPQKLQNDIIDAVGENAKADVVRANSTYYIGPKTRQQLKDIALLSENEPYFDGNDKKDYPGRERGYLLHYTKRNKQLQVTDITDKYKWTNARGHSSFEFAEEQIDAFNKENSSSIIVMYGHTHGYYSLLGNGYGHKGNDNLENLNTPSRDALANIYQDYHSLPVFNFLNTNKNGTMAAMVATKYGYTIYATQRTSTAAETKNGTYFSIIENLGQGYNYSGTLLIDYGSKWK